MGSASMPQSESSELTAASIFSRIVSASAGEPSAAFGASSERTTASGRPALPPGV